MNKVIDFVIRNYIRLLIILFWLGGLIGFLMLPHVANMFTKERSLCIYMWSDKIDESVLYQFEQETGIKVYVNYYESNEELLTKLEISKTADCDIILPSDYMVEALWKAGLLKKIDASKCDFLDRIYPEFKGRFYDPKNEYSVPLYWDVLGIGYTHSYFPQGLPSNSWALAFNKEDIPCKKISMIDDSRESIFLAATYLGWPIQQLDTKQLKKLKKLFIQQKKWVGVYTDFQQGYYLSSQTYPFAVSQREYMAREMIDNDDIGFIVPKEGSLLTIDNIVISASSKKDDLVYQLINYLYKHETVLFNVKEFCVLPVLQDVLENLPKKYIGIDGIKPGEKIFNRLHMFPNILTQKQMNDLWIGFKAS